MCWENEGATNDYFYLKNPLYYIYGSRDLFKGILESKFESEIEEIMVQENNLRKSLQDAIPREDEDCLLFFLDELNLDDLKNSKNIVLGKLKGMIILKMNDNIKITF